MKLKIAILAACAAAITGKVQAQQPYAIIKGGVNLANVSITDNGNIDEAKSITSFQAGIVGNFHIASLISFQPGLLFSGKGSKTEVGQTTDASYYRATSNPYYIEIPANVVVKTPSGQVKLFAGAGPYLAIGIAGKNKVDGKIFGTSFAGEKKIEWSNEDPSTPGTAEGAGFGILKRFDYGLNGLAGVEFKKSVIAVNYGYGLAKLQNGSTNTEDNNNKHRVWSLSLGFKL